MNRLTSGLAALSSLLLIAGCNGDATDSLRGPATDLVASPSQVFIELGATKKVDVSAVDAQGNQLTEAFEVTSVGSGITVTRDSSFRGEFINDSLFAVPATDLQFRFSVVGTAYGPTSFTVSAGGVDKVIPVQVAPQNQIGTTFSTSTPALGDTVTVTAPGGTTFTQTALLQVSPGSADSLNPRIVERDPNGSFIRFVPPPNLNGPIIITEVTSTAAPGLVFSPATSELLTTPVIDTVDVTFSTSTPAIGQTVTATIQNPLIKFRPEVASTPGQVRFGITFPGQLPGPLLGPDSLHLRSGAGAQAIVVAPDSNSLTFQAPPNAAGPATVISFVFPGGFSLALPTRTGVTTPNIGTTVNATFSDNSPPAASPVTLTAPGGFRFNPVLAADTVTIGGNIAINQSAAADGSTITIVPIPGSVGTAVISGVQLTATPQFTMTMPTIQADTVPALEPLAGTDDPTTAPIEPVPAVGGSTSFADAGSFTGADITGDGGLAVAQYYKITMPAPGNLTVTTDWFNTADIDQIVCDDVGGVLDPDTCLFDAATGSQPESATYALTAGDHYIVLVLFDGAPPSLMKVTLER